MRLIARLVAFAAIVGFWGVMWWQLIRSELRPDETSLRAVPLELAVRQYFEHEQPSDLFLRESGNAMGRLRLTPKAPEGEYSLQFSGNMQMTTAGAMPLRTAWDGQFTMDRAMHPLSFRGSFTSRATPSLKVPVTRLEWTADLQAKTAWYRYRTDNEVVAEQDFTLDREGLNKVAERWGVPADWTKQTMPISASTGDVTARLMPFSVHGEKVEAIVISVKFNGQTWLEVFVSQLGPVLQVKTLWGWVLETE